MSRFQAISVSDKEKAFSFASIVKWCNVTVNLGWEYSKTGFVMGYGLVRQIGWFVVTTGIITALPLMFEIKRESLLDLLEGEQISKLAAEGLTPQEIAQQGLAAAIDPSVL